MNLQPLKLDVTPGTAYRQLLGHTSSGEPIWSYAHVILLVGRHVITGQEMIAYQNGQHIEIASLAWFQAHHEKALTKERSDG